MKHKTDILPHPDFNLAILTHQKFIITFFLETSSSTISLAWNCSLDLIGLN